MSKIHYVGYAIGGGLLTLAGSVVFSRLYSPSDFGSFYNWMFLANLIGGLFVLNLDAYYPYSNDNEGTYIREYWSALMRSFIFLFPVVVIAAVFCNVKGIIIYFLILKVLIIRLTNSFWVSNGDLFALGRGKFLSSLSIFSARLIFAPFSVLALGFSEVLGALPFVTKLKALFRRGETQNLRVLNNLRRSENVSYHIKWSYLINLLDLLYDYILVLLLEYKFGLEISGGIFFLLFRGQAVLNVFYGALTHMKQIELNGKQAKSNIGSYALITLLFCILSYIAIHYFGEKLIVFTFGEKWLFSLVYVKYYLPFMWLNALNVVFGFVPVQFRRQRSMMLFAILRPLSVLLVYVLCDYDSADYVRLLFLILAGIGLGKLLFYASLFYADIYK